MQHRYLESLVVPEEELECDRVFEFQFEKQELDRETLQRLMAEEVCQFHPEAEAAKELKRLSSNATNRLSSKK